MNGCMDVHRVGGRMGGGMNTEGWIKNKYINTRWMCNG